MAMIIFGRAIPIKLAMKIKSKLLQYWKNQEFDIPKITSDNRSTNIN